jgi:hypothetical protein
MLVAVAVEWVYLAHPQTLVVLEVVVVEETGGIHQRQQLLELQT